MNRAERRALKKRLKSKDLTIPEIIQSINNTKYASELSELIKFILEPSKNLNPHKMIRQLSDDILATLCQKSLDGPLFQYYELFQIETMWRQGLLKEDWEWDWVTESEGAIRFLKN